MPGARAARHVGDRPEGPSVLVGSWASPSAAAGCFASRGDQCMVFARNNGKYIVGMGCGYVNFLVKKNKLVGWKIEKWDSTLFRQTF